MRKMEEVEKIASVSSNMKRALVRRLRLASRRTKASGAELQQRTVDTSAAASTVAGLCRLRIRDDGVGDDDMRMDKSGGTETTDKDVGSNNGQEGICGRGCVLWKVRLGDQEGCKGDGASGGVYHNKGGKRKGPEAPARVTMGPPPPPTRMPTPVLQVLFGREGSPSTSLWELANTAE
jgi:hypothetical protein